MRLYIDLDTRAVTTSLIERSHIREPLLGTRGDGEELEIQFHRTGVPERLPSDYGLVFAVKTQGKYDQDPPIFVTGSFNRPAEDNGYYTGAVEYIGSQLDDALSAQDGNPDNDLAQITFMAEVSWQKTGLLPRSSRTILLAIQNDVWKGSEIPDVAPAPPFISPRWAPWVNALVGGGASALDGLAVGPATSLPDGSFLLLYCEYGGITRARHYLLQARSEETESAPDRIIPDANNSFVWLLIS